MFIFYQHTKSNNCFTTINVDSDLLSNDVISNFDKKTFYMYFNFSNILTNLNLLDSLQRKYINRDFDNIVFVFKYNVNV